MHKYAKKFSFTFANIAGRVAPSGVMSFESMNALYLRKLSK
jgi:hypothetical protein